MVEITITVIVSTLVLLALSVLVLTARHWLVPVGCASITINDTRSISAPLGERLLQALASHGIVLPAACGGRGACGQCRLTITAGARELLPSELAHISKRDGLAGERLACLLTIRRDMTIRLPDDALAARRWQCHVVSNESLTTYLKALVLQLDDDSAAFAFDAGDYVTLEAPAGSSRFEDFELGACYRDEWQRQRWFDLVSTREAHEVRAYSIANAPDETGSITLIVRIATPPPSAPRDTEPGKVSSYIFGLRKGDEVTVSGPFDGFHVKESEAEMILIGGGAGIAPLRAIILDQLLNRSARRRMSLWYGARNTKDICLEEELNALAARFEHFQWHAALSDPTVDANWSGPRGFIHSVVYERYLADHPAPEEAEYYVCGPPLMTSAVIALLEDLGVDSGNIFLDDFGG